MRKPRTISDFMQTGEPSKRKLTTRRTRPVETRSVRISATSQRYLPQEIFLRQCSFMQNPPGTEEMRKLREAIQYAMENTERGGRIRITTKNPKAVSAVHEFLRFQIADHQTGDSPEITNTP